MSGQMLEERSDSARAGLIAHCMPRGRRPGLGRGESSWRDEGIGSGGLRCLDRIPARRLMAANPPWINGSGNILGVFSVDAAIAVQIGGGAWE